MLLPGLSGGNDNLYTLSLVEEAKKNGYKCGTIIMRGCSGLKLKSAKLTCAASHDDAYESIDFVHKKYNLDKKGNKRQKMFIYGVSLGAMLLCRCLILYGKKVPVDGAVIYSAGWDTIEGLDYFRNNLFGFYSYGLCFP